MCRGPTTQVRYDRKRLGTTRTTSPDSERSGNDEAGTALVIGAVPAPPLDAPSSYFAASPTAPVGTASGEPATFRAPVDCDTPNDEMVCAPPLRVYRKWLFSVLAASLGAMPVCPDLPSASRRASWPWWTE